MSGGNEINSSETSSWWEEWVQNAKEKSVSVLNLVKKDLAEFGTVMQCDGSRVANVVREKFNQETASSASKKMKDGMTSLWGELSKALVIPHEDDDCYEVVKITDGKPVAFDRVKAQLYGLQTSISTYTDDPSANDDKFKTWVESSWNLEIVKPEISDLLVSNASVRSLYTQLVPLKVSNNDFWCRYFYKKHLLDEEENRRIALVKRAGDIDENELTWDEDEENVLKECPANNTKSETSGDSKDVPITKIEDKILNNDNGNENVLPSTEPKMHSSESIESDLNLPSPDESPLCHRDIIDKPSSTLTEPDITNSPNPSDNEGIMEESPTDDWEKVCNDFESQKAPDWNEIQNSNDWEEW